MKTIILPFIIFLFAAGSATGQTASITPKDLRVLEGAEWVGELTYLDYSSNQRTSIRSNPKVAETADTWSWRFEYIYPNEPGANSVSVVRPSKDGGTLNGQRVVECSRLPGGEFRVVTIGEGTDNNRKAFFRYTYTISKDRFSVLKEVRLDGTEVFFERNTYNWAR